MAAARGNLSPVTSMPITAGVRFSVKLAWARWAVGDGQRLDLFITKGDGGIPQLNWYALGSLSATSSEA